MGVETLIRGRVSRNLGTPQVDGIRDGDAIRTGRYGEQYILSLLRKQHGLADEGSFFMTNNAQTGIAGPAVASFGATTPIMVVSNTDVPGPNAKRMYIDSLTLVTTAAGGWASAGVNEQAVLVVDTGDRYSSGGTDLSNNIVSPNMDGPARNSIARVRFGNITAAAANGGVRTLCGLRILRPAVSSTVADVVGETKTLNFGGVEAMLNGSITVANANMISVPMPPVILGPAQCMLLYFILNGTTPSAASFAPELSWFER